MAKRGKNRSGKDFDVMNPEDVSPNAKKAMKEAGKIAKEAVKLIGKVIKKLVELLLHLGWVGILILLIIILVIIIVAFQHMPGMMRDKLLNFFNIDSENWFANGAVSSLNENYQDIIDVANYLEQMDYNLIGDGFVRPALRTENDSTLTFSETENRYPNYTYQMDDDGVARFHDETGEIPDITYYNNLGQKIDNSTGEPILNNDKFYIDEFGIVRTISEGSNSALGADAGSETLSSRGKVAPISLISNSDRDEDSYAFTEDELEEYTKRFRLLRTYLLSNYRIYTLRNSDEDMLTTIYNAIATIGGNEDAWAKGLIKLYNAEGGIATKHWWWGRGLLGEAVSIDGTTLSLKKGWFNNEMKFSIEGWAPRYGMSLEFLLSLHLGTGAPDLMNAMLQNFDTEVQVYLDDSGKSEINASYVDPQDIVNPASGDTIEKVEAVLAETGHNVESWAVEDGEGALQWFNDIVNDMALNKEACQDLLVSSELTLTSPENCLGAGQAYIIEKSTYETNSILFMDTSKNALNTYGIYGTTDPEVYEEFSSYENYEFKNDSGELLEFTPEHCTQEIGIDDTNALNNDFTWFSSIAVNAGFNLSNMSSPSTNEFETYVNAPDILDVLSGVSEYHQSGKVYKVKKVKNYNTWPTEVDGEELNYDWVSYKYLIYEVGTFDQSGILLNALTHEVSWGDREITYSGEETWVDTVMVEFILREKTIQEAIDSRILTIDENGNPHYNLSAGRCSEQKDSSGKKTQNRCCSVCQEYVKAVIKAIANISDQNYSSYTPYIARVVGSWFRDTYFVIPKATEGDPTRTDDVAINEYAGKIIEVEGRSYDENGDSPDLDNDEYYSSLGALGDGEEKVKSASHPEFDYENCFGENAKYVKVDSDYMEDTGEYWTAYEMNGDDYQLYVLNGDGTTSETTLEEFLETGEIKNIKGYNEDGEPRYETKQATIDGEPVNGYSSKEEAEKAGWAFVKKAKVEKFTSNTADGGDRIDSKVLWTAYTFDSSGSASEWKRVSKGENSDVDKLYNIIYGEDSEGEENSGIFYQLKQTNSITQIEDAQRGQTNPLVKYLFKYRKFYIYDGGEDRGLAIEHDKQRVLYGYDDYVSKNYDYDNKYYNNKVLADPKSFRETGYEEYTGDNFYHFIGLLGDNGLICRLYSKDGEIIGWNATKNLIIKDLNNFGRGAIRESYSWATDSEQISNEDLATQWLDWQLDMLYMNRFGVNIQDYYGGSENGVPNDLLKLTFDPRDPDLISTVEITKNSLSVFSILENTGTLDADYAYRDFKELIVELDYFDKEELSEKVPSIFTWILPEHNPISGWPVRPYDKADVDYGTLIHSEATYNALDSYTSRKTTEEIIESTEETEETGDGEEDTDATPEAIEPEELEEAEETPVEGNGSTSSGKIDTSKIFWIGDSWVVGLGSSGVADLEAEPVIGGNSVMSGYFFAKGSQDASWALDNYSALKSQIESKSPSALVIHFGLNNTNSYGKTQELIEKLHSDFPNIPINMLKISHVASTYRTEWYTADELNSKIDEYNSQMSSWCSGKDYVTFIEGTTNNIVGDDGYLMESYATSDGLHMSGEGYEVWYNGIIEGLGNTSSSGSSQLAKFKGYKAGELVSSPVTGKILEVGTHERMNLYTQQMETVDYIVIEVANNEEYFQSSMFDGYDYETTSEGYETPESALNLFYDEYENVCAGYTIMIDGIDVDLSLTSSDSGSPDLEPNEGEELEESEEPEESEETAGNSSQNSINGSYKKRTEEELRGYALYNSEEWKKLIDKEQAKEDAPCFINYGESSAYPKPEDNYKAEDGLKGYYIKEGKYIGKTIEGTEATKTEIPEELETSDVEVSDTERSDIETSNDSIEKLTYTYYDYEGPADYIRIIIKDLDYAIVDNVEDFFDIADVAGNSTTEAFTGDYSEEFLYWMLVLCEGLSQDEVKQGYSVAKDIGDGTVTVAMGVTNHCNQYFWNLGYGEYMHGSHVGNTGMNVGDHVPLDVIRDIAIAFIDDKVKSIEQVFPGIKFDEYQIASILSVMYNFGSVPNSLQEAIKGGDEANIRSTWENLGSSQFDQYPGLAKRRKAESIMFLDKKWTALSSGAELQFSSNTPFSDYFSGKNFNVASE